MTQKALQDAGNPTAMDDATATRLGLKVYSHGGTYTGSPNAPTITSPIGAITVLGSTFIPYQMQNGSWRMRFNFNFTCGATNPLVDADISGVLFGAFLQPVSLDSPAQSVSLLHQRTEVASTRMTLRFSGVVTELIVSGDVSLTSKPTWAY